jgi:hypothetical protein
MVKGQSNSSMANNYEEGAAGRSQPAVYNSLRGINQMVEPCVILPAARHGDAAAQINPACPKS